MSDQPTDNKKAAGAQPDFNKFRLRTFLDSLRQLDGASEIDVRSEPVRLADVAGILERSPRAVLFEKAGAPG